MYIFRFYRGKRVFVTGHTGFKGSWLVFLLRLCGAEVYGYALPPRTPSLFSVIEGEKMCGQTLADVADLSALQSAFGAFRPEIVFHLAAQPLVSEGYNSPVSTFATNTMGTVHLLECVRRCGSVRSVVNVTTDKVYRERPASGAYRENDELGGRDPYSASKSCSELAAFAYAQSYLQGQGKALSCVRAGNAIGGGDFAENRIVPDCVRAALRGEPVILRNPHAVRPYQHVLEPLFAYLTVAAMQAENASLAGCYNVGPAAEDCADTLRLASLFCEFWPGASYTVQTQAGAPHEAQRLLLDNTKIKEAFGIRPVWDVRTAVQKTVEWTQAWRAGQSVKEVMRSQAEEYFAAANKNCQA